ncbi:MAG: redoxin domain-containing protein [Flavobacteriales bacterium]|nr:redoxin domain-containing protein [Flavobacteriales bacterium]
MTRALFFAFAQFGATHAHANTFSITVTAVGLKEDVVQIHRYADLFTMRTLPLAQELFNADRQATLTASVEGTMRIQLRIGERGCDLYVRPGSNYHIKAYDLGKARSLSGTTPLGITFLDLDPLDINALTTDVNERIDAFIAEDLATDEVAGMQAVDIQRKEGSQRPDSSQRPPTLFVTPVLSKARSDTFAFKLRRFYDAVDDEWFGHYLEYSIAGIQQGPQVNERKQFETQLQGKPILYDDPEYVRFIRNFYSESLERIYRYSADSLQIAATSKSKDALRRLFQHNDLLRESDRLAELVMIDQLYLNHARKMVRQVHAEAILADVMEHSTFIEHRTIAENMLWDLTTMRVGTMLPAMRLEDPSGKAVQLEDFTKGPTCIAITAGWCTYCATELAGLVQLGSTYPNAVDVIVIGLDEDLDAFNRMRKGSPQNEFTWLHAPAGSELRESLRLRSLPAFFLLNDGVLARSPAPPPSNGLGELFIKAKVEAEKGQRLKVWDD